MEKIQLGKTGLEVTKFGLGGIQLAKMSDDDAVRVVRTGVERGLSRNTIEVVRNSVNCTQCRECEKRCPFNLEIVEGLIQSRSMVERLVASHGLDQA